MSSEDLVKDQVPEPCDADFFGPALPPHFLQKKLPENQISKIIGPVLPHFSGKEKVNKSNYKEENEILIGPEIPECLRLNQKSKNLEEGGSSGVCKEDNFGPSTTLMAREDIEYSYRFRNVQRVKPEARSEPATKRESWMTELPEKKKPYLGLFPRNFKSQVLTDKESDDSVWTDTPANKTKIDHTEKNDLKEIIQMKMLEERDKEMEKLAKKAAKKLRKKESLMEMHLKRVKKKKKEEAKIASERRPFDRNVDLQILKFDEGQKRTILRKSQFLNDRFAFGQSKFL